MKAAVTRGPAAVTPGAARRPSRGFALRAPMHGTSVAASPRQSIDRIDALPFGPLAIPNRAKPEIGPVDGSGQPLDTGIQRRVGAAFERDFSAPRVHADNRTAGSAASIGARAYTFGNHFAFGQGQYAPGSTTSIFTIG